MKLQWDDVAFEKKREFIASRSPLLDESETYKILMCGAIRAGKSSVINTILSALRNEIGQIAFSAEEDESVTRKFRVFRLRKSVEHAAIRVTLCDTMGFEQREALSGPSIRDFEYIMDGHIKDGYEFKPNDCISFNSEFFERNPKPMDKVHAVVVVVDASTAQTMTKEVVDKLKEVTHLANDRDIRWCVVVTKIDKACPNVDLDLTTVFSSTAMEQCVETIHNQFGCIASNIFPIQNYGQQVEVSLPMNILALHNLENILRLADNTLESQAGILPIDCVPPPEKPLMKDAWKNEEKLTDEAVGTMWEELSALVPERVTVVRLCCMGPSGAGKSSFINSALSEFYQRIMTTAETGRRNSPCTTNYQEYRLKQGRDGEELDIKLIDTMGCTDGSNGMLLEDIPTVLDGKAKNRAPFNPSAPLRRSDGQPTLDSSMHLLVLVVNGVNTETYSPTAIDKMKKAMDYAKSKEIPRVVLVTHVDRVCGHVAADPSKVFRSELVKACLEKVHEKLQVCTQS